MLGLNRVLNSAEMTAFAEIPARSAWRHDYIVAELKLDEGRERVTGEEWTPRVHLWSQLFVGESSASGL